MKIGEKSVFDEQRFMLVLIKTFLVAFKWLELMMCVLTAGVTISLLIVTVIKGENASVILLNKLFYLATMIDADKVSTYLSNYGLVTFCVAGVSYGGVRALTYGLKHLIIKKMEELMNSFTSTSKLFTKENLELIDETIPLTYFIALAPPIMLYVIADVLKVFNNINPDVSGIVIILFAFFVKLIFDKGYEETKKLTKTDRLLSDAKAVYSELKMEVIAKDAQLKSKVKELNALKDSKDKKEEPKKVEEKKRKPRTKKK